MQVLFAVIEDLWNFGKTSLFGFFFETNLATHAEIQAVTQHAPQLTLLPSSTHESVAPLLLKEQAPEPVFLQGEQYFIGETGAHLYVDPVFAFDSALQVLSYGDLVYVQKLGGRWAHIKTALYEGWVLKDVLREKAKDVFPQLIDGVFYDAQNPQTEQIRLYIGDMFMGGSIASVLIDVEYVTYMLKKKGKEIAWNHERPRVAGTWQRKLRGTKGVHIGITPKTDSVMEYVVDDVGHLAYVEAVFPDETIKLTSVGIYEEGTFGETLIQKEEWRELRPVFIEIL